MIKHGYGNFVIAYDLLFVNNRCLHVSFNDSLVYWRKYASHGLDESLVNIHAQATTSN